MTLGIDIDDTITNTTILANEYLKKYDESCLDYHQLSKKKYKEYMRQYIADILKNVSLKDGVKEAFDYFNELGYHVIFITARGNTYSKKVKDITLDYLKNHDIQYDKIIFGKSKKGRIAKKNHIDIFIDDKEAVLDEMKKYKIETIRFTKEASNHQTFSDWKDIVNYLEKKEG